MESCPPFCLPSSFHVVSHYFALHHPFILSLLILSLFHLCSYCFPSSFLVVSPHVFSLPLCSCCFPSYFPFVSHRAMCHHNLSHHPSIPTKDSSWVQSLEAKRPAQSLGPQLLAMLRVPHHFVSRHLFIVSLFLPPPPHPQLQKVPGLNF